ncbi:MAG TPA: fused MFS/spermidine synthase, partial [Candidatus Binatia bacterium]|nr:fused MFS/spermidine synthase [Candidatus Binatia bacterium]
MLHRRGTAALAACFLFSGLGSLVLEVVWTRQLRLVFGSTTLAASTILVAYMLGLGLGALAGGRLGSRLGDGVRAYGWLEIAIGVYALAVPFVLQQFPVLNRALLYQLPFWPAALCRFVLALAVLIVPTLLMGATLPVLVRAVIGRERSGRMVALLYGINTLGAMAGVLLSTFVFFPRLGLTPTAAVGAGIDIAVGVFALLVLAPRLARVEAEEAPPPTAPARRWHVLLPAYAVVGFTSLVLEVGWTRALAMVFGSSIHAFACMLAAFLAGIALGSLAAQRLVDRVRRPAVAGAVAIAALGVATLATTLLLPRLPDVFVRGVAIAGGLKGRVIVEFLIGVVAMLPSTLILGSLFPLLARALADERERTEAAVGDVYFANTVGSAAGAFAAGFLLIPALGLRGTLALASALVLATAGGLLLVALRGRARLVAGLVSIAGAVALLLVPLPWPETELVRGVFRNPLRRLDVGVKLLPMEGVPIDELVFYQDGLNATVSVHQGVAVRYLKINGKTDASVPSDMATQVMSAHIPLLFGAPAEKVLVIGIASGVTVGSAARHPVRRIDAVEIEPAVVAASHYFDDFNGRPLEDPRVRVIVDDGRTYLSGTPERYDVIISEPSNPWISGVSNLFTREFFQAAHGALTPDGRLLQWMQLYGLDPTGFRAILAAMRSEFPFVTVFVGDPNLGDVLLLGSLTPLRREHLPRWEALPPAIREDLVRVRNLGTADLWSLVRLLPADVDRIVADAPVVNSDENLHVELASPWLLESENETVDANWAL